MTIKEFIEEWQNAAPCVTVHTSGSTGQPKPMQAEKARMRASARMTCDFLGLQPGDTALLCMPLDFIAGKMMVVRALERQMKLLQVTPSNHPLKDVTEPVTFAAMVPSQVYCSLQEPEERDRLMAIRHLIIGGGALSAELESALQAHPGHVWSTYGMTETLSHVAMRRINGAERSLWYEPMPGVQIGLSGEGCLVIDAPAVSPVTLTTNDMAEMHADGRHFRIVGRKDNVICSGGIKLQAEQIEEKLRPFMHQPFAITKRVDAKLGETAILAVEGEGEKAAFLAVCREHLTPYEVPRDILFVDQLPLTETGKIARAELARKAMAT